MATVLFVFAHPDDETLAAGVAIPEHIVAGHDVHLLWLTRGTASSALGYLNGAATASWWGVPHNPTSEGYLPLDAAGFGQARIDEATTAVRCLSSGLGWVTCHEAGLTDGAVTQSAAQDAVLGVCEQINPGGVVWLKTHTHLVDNNLDHVAAGAACRQLAVEYPARFGNVRHYIESPYWSDARLGAVVETWDYPTSAAISARTINACRAFGAWAPEVGRFAIGWHSVPGLFAAMVSAPKNLYHP